MSRDCNALVTSYLKWLKEQISISDIDGVCEITTPFLDRHNARLQIYVRRREGRYELTDDGFVLGDLESCGCPVNTDTRRQLLATILAGFGVQEEDGELRVEASADNFPQRKHALLQAMMTVNDMFMVARPRIAHLFLEDVAHFLDEHDVRHSQNVDFVGKSGFVHRFDFLIPRSRTKPERLVRAINHPTRDHATAVIFAHSDTIESRPPKTDVFAILNDSESSINPDIVTALQHYKIRPLRWSEREQFVSELAA
jgi:Domain of unknown function DUF1829/Domain of unknown function DUF1828